MHAGLVLLKHRRLLGSLVPGPWSPGPLFIPTLTNCAAILCTALTWSHPYNYTPSTNGSYTADWQACKQIVSANVNSRFFTAFLHKALATYIRSYYYTTHWFLKPFIAKCVLRNTNSDTMFIMTNCTIKHYLNNKIAIHTDRELFLQMSWQTTHLKLSNIQISC